MAAKYDVEDMLDSVLAIMTDGGALNAKIAAVEAEKAAASKSLDPVLSSIASGSYHAQTWTDKVLQSNPAIFYGVEDVEAVDGGGVIAKTYKLFVEVVMVDSGMTNDVWKRISRYARALEELFTAAYGPAIFGGSVKVTSIRPMAFKLEMGTNDEVRVGGISLSITMV